MPASAAYGATVDVLTYVVPMLASAIDYTDLEDARTSLSGFIDSSTALTGRGKVEWAGDSTSTFELYVDKTSLTVSNVARTSGVVTVTTSAAHGLVAGDRVKVTATTNTGINGTYVIASAPTTTTFTYAKAGDNITSGADTGSVLKGLLKLDGTDKAIRIMGLTGIPKNVDTQSDQSMVLDPELSGTMITVASSNSYSFPISGLVDRKSYAWKIMTALSEYAVIPGLAAKILRVGPAGSTEAVIGFGRFSSISEDGDAGALQKFSGNFEAIGPLRTLPDNTGI